MMQNSDSPSIIILELTPFSVSILVARVKRLDIRLRQSANLFERVINISVVGSLRSFERRDFPQKFILVFKIEFARTVRVGKGPKVAETTLSEAGVAIVLTTPIPGAPGWVLRVKPPR